MYQLWAWGWAVGWEKLFLESGLRSGRPSEGRGPRALLAGLGLSRPLPLPALLRRYRLGARPKPAAFQGGRHRVPAGQPKSPSFSLKFRTPWTFGRSAECASSEQFVFHGAFASITPLLLCLFLDHWGWRRHCQSAVGAGQRGGREGRPLVAHLHTPVPGTGPRGALNTAA